MVSWLISAPLTESYYGRPMVTMARQPKQLSLRTHFNTNFVTADVRRPGSFAGRQTGHDRDRECAAAQGAPEWIYRPRAMTTLASCYARMMPLEAGGSFLASGTRARRKQARKSARLYSPPASSSSTRTAAALASDYGSDRQGSASCAPPHPLRSCNHLRTT